MSDDEREAIERKLEHETRFLQRQELMKRLWRLTNANDARNQLYMTPPRTIASQDESA
jgi:hypothetical protein